MITRIQTEKKGKIKKLARNNLQVIKPPIPPNQRWLKEVKWMAFINCSKVKKISAHT